MASTLMGSETATWLEFDLIESLELNFIESIELDFVESVEEIIEILEVSARSGDFPKAARAK